MEWLETDLSMLQPGYRFPMQQFRLDRATIDAYLAAVEDDTAIYRGEGALVPPLALIALSMRGLAALLAARPGTVHISQRLAAHRPVPVDSAVTVDLAVQSRSERRGFAVLNLDVQVRQDAPGGPETPAPGYGSDGEIALTGAMLLMVPLAQKGTTGE